MRLRNGKRGYDERLKCFEQDKIKKQQAEDYLKIRHGEAVPRLSISISRRQSRSKQSEIIKTPEQLQAENIKKAEMLYKIYEKKLDDADKNTGKLWSVNGKLEKVFLKKIMEQSKKEGASKRLLEKIKTNIEIYEKEESILKKENDFLLKKNKKLELEAKRAFVNSKRKLAGEYLTELEESTIRYRKNANCNEEKDCSICRDVIGHSRSVVTKECSHCFHEDCFDNWMELSSNCPMCRTCLEPAIEKINQDPSEGGFGRIHDVTSWATTTATNTR